MFCWGGGGGGGLGLLSYPSKDKNLTIPTLSEGGGGGFAARTLFVRPGDIIDVSVGAGGGTPAGEGAGRAGTDPTGSGLAGAGGRGVRGGGGGGGGAASVVREL